VLSYTQARATHTVPLTLSRASYINKCRCTCMGKLVPWRGAKVVSIKTNDSKASASLNSMEHHIPCEPSSHASMGKPKLQKRIVPPIFHYDPVQSWLAPHRDRVLRLGERKLRSQVVLQAHAAHILNGTHHGRAACVQCLSQLFSQLCGDTLRSQSSYACGSAACKCIARSSSLLGRPPESQERMAIAFADMG